jgi:hypothetical protein
MSSHDPTPALLSRMQRVLSSPAANAVRFQLDNVAIHSYMLGYIATAVGDDRVHVRVDGSRANSYNPEFNTINFIFADPDDATIVHESTHAAIDATNPGLAVTVATGEAVAYVAESVYALNAGFDDHTIDDRGIMRAAYVLARQIRAYNAINPSGVYTCPPSDVATLKSALIGSRLAQDFAKSFVQDGLGEGPRRGLIGSMILQSRGK